jgi:hypothetical protein
MLREKEKAPAPVRQDQGRGGSDRVSNSEFSARRSKRKLKNFWFEDGGRYLCRYGANGSTIFAVWKWFSEPLPTQRGRA